MRFLASIVAVTLSPVAIGADSRFDYRILATTKTSTMEKEMNEAAEAGYRFSHVMGGDSAVGGKEVIVAMVKNPSAPGEGARKYKLLATSRTSTMQKEMQALADEGFEYLGQTVFQSSFGGREVTVIMERNPEKKDNRSSYLLLATSKTSTMQKELNEAGAKGYSLIGFTVGKTALGGSELVSILRKE
jgi:hypothetical protein